MKTGLWLAALRDSRIKQAEKLYAELSAIDRGELIPEDEKLLEVLAWITLDSDTAPEIEGDYGDDD